MILQSFKKNVLSMLGAVEGQKKKGKNEAKREAKSVRRTYHELDCNFFHVIDFLSKNDKSTVRCIHLDVSIDLSLFIYLPDRMNL